MQDPFSKFTSRHLTNESNKLLPTVYCILQATGLSIDRPNQTRSISGDRRAVARTRMRRRTAVMSSSQAVKLTVGL